MPRRPRAVAATVSSIAILRHVERIRVSRYIKNFLRADRKWSYLASKVLLLFGADLKWKTVEIDEGVRIYAHSSKESLGYLLEHDYKLHERLFYTRLFRPGDAFVDVGANIGVFSLIAAARVGETGHVHAFEPSGKVYRELVENIALNGLIDRVSAYDVALGDQNRRAQFYVRKYSDDFGSLSPEVHDPTSVEQVEMVRADTVLRGTSRITLLKIDVEGAEYHVLRGFSDLLEKVKFVRFEAHQDLCAPFGVVFSMIANLLATHGLTTYRIDGERLAPLPSGYSAEVRADHLAVRDGDRHEFTERTGYQFA